MLMTSVFVVALKLILDYLNFENQKNLITDYAISFTFSIFHSCIPAIYGRRVCFEVAIFLSHLHLQGLDF